MQTHSAPSPSRQNVWQMFDRIAHRYDFLNHTLSMGIDTLWRQKLAQQLPPRPDLKLLDLATGTADVLITLCQENKSISEALGLDLSEQMLSYGRQKLKQEGLENRAELRLGDACEIPVEAASYDAVTMSFGIRNVLDMDLCLREIYRSLKPGGRALILEFSLPESRLVRPGYLLYLRHLLPRIGAAVSGDDAAYRYLNQTIETFPCGQDFCDHMIAAGFQNVDFMPQTFGIATIYQGDKAF
ncbi:bifunctional demethylmenaquinone methyltransferase/2-methoxy-6-polyprenyl-1,4-benzoquinol methylase UbiE [bacterium (Candidatus Blackallbacteria) CG17_big_fil_post_rev_8_21_14_2_50_48_46]|uniref:Demethylmenaquinone methyltransferase n=1 Tax=bacterium (Candidatus Blackallbacteria) CG17_big_fil_post_rev_8_21_14_2_50_48_46 TaxID=2014261 RepID=A0A2M7FYE9_9BACT|nr:MAG: bifunctional demethylmenaquinone methyltransferase/2-methoxy-6-polyprenyl-1,4-benzoquinol methylase UbiE [bacterium (Candidatus Blackallbacteria) CG18_big_fil_WC_8_21_14_2_50_49_26]PIW14331.1 MAG: bifunctional demethylmenaquinone methyltransferase/2-methoxy-6-polyprenyl-1,4-benzoquinol methylase UbiE [bacterium (Candidatus Blackallbacteria) CG17_big_fil_post_rev_8_21_14_2_50_48_46]PIW45600.1 MAG: bifunctional demethylmenaquinone methyltransferase/2-methoxy-6-polyprenyl-1,4-benzoquinol met